MRSYAFMDSLLQEVDTFSPTAAISTRRSHCLQIRAIDQRARLRDLTETAAPLPGLHDAHGLETCPGYQR